MAESAGASWSIAAKSVGPYQSIPAITDDGAPAIPMSPSRSSTPLVTVAIAARWPPADSPHTASRSGSMPTSDPLARNHRMAALTSWSCAGKDASPLSL